jgi:hypothetical protein
MLYQQLRERLENQEKYPGCVKRDRAPLIHPGFPGNFNLSFAELHWLNEYGRYVDFDHDFIFSTIMSCIRPNDFSLLQTRHSWKYLGVFEMADLGGIITSSERPDYKKLQRRRVTELIDFLKSCGLNPDNIYPVYCAGGTVEELTAGKYTFDFSIPEDRISKEAFLENGIPEENLIPDKSRDSFLALHVYGRTSPWGYRNEVNINLGDKENPDLLDIATLEYGMWRPIFKNTDESRAANVCYLKDSLCGFSISVVGLERLCMAINGFHCIRDVDYIAPVYDAYAFIDGVQDELAVESLRALHRIYSDVQSCGCIIGRHQKRKIREFLQNIPSSLSQGRIKELLTIHSATQPWHTNTEQGIEPTIERITEYRAARLR